MRNPMVLVMMVDFGMHVHNVCLSMHVLIKILIFPLESQQPCVVYSLGVGWDSTFEMEMISRTNCEVYAYDFSVPEMPIPDSFPKELKNRLHFHRLGLGSKIQAKEDTRFRTLTQIMEENGHK